MSASDRQPLGERSFGRRKGHKLSLRQSRLVDELLPRLQPDLSQPPPDPLTTLFAAPVSEVWLEIGFGAGEHLLWQARANPHAGLLGCEPYINGVAKVLTAVETHDLRNVAVHPDDARDLLSWLPEASIARAFILFPDPWPKRRHRKRRFLREENIAALARVMQPGGELRFATDIGDYARTALLAFMREGSFAWTAQRPRDWRERPDDWPQTRYEAKAIAAGRACAYFRFRRR
ncbi:tRNA (guanine(46)-N(7))-methyltransferase TrmB [Dichotomicrobium thermohalophilum]|uniref:tRNA (guanine-N(7)-)-methyltransferase n=1 Tax=Dichotomicrobium thermohalophilum TaxID=933063 RepID=A0A397PJA0_9HYPH|nr:tRNA (guanine(46)-N(7))-methyltransferase TrmB [Dichotomicrobium thermohalophilum]RIA47355.1 tRNA (guanine-N7-)-methyltransferase [Dichotomicrobium thermohalophilum]